MLAKIRETAAWLQARTALRPEIAIVLGSGLGNLAKQISVVDAFEYKDIPHFPVSTVEGHHGRLLFGHLAGRPVMAMEGRFHYYEGYDMKQVTFPERVMHELGITTFIVSNAAGGMNPNFHVGDIMLIADHINLFPEHPLRGQNLPTGPRFPDMSHPYSPRLMDLADKCASELGIKLTRGVYVGVTGPAYETGAECNFFRTAGGDAVGMSTVPEVIVARHCGMRVLGMAVITDMAPDSEEETYVTDGEEIIRIAKEAASKMTRLLMRFLQNLQ